MEWESLNFAFDYLSSNGTVFSTESRVSIQSSLILLQSDNQFNKVHFWGRIEGAENDYYIACGIGKDFIKDRVYFYSINLGLDWILLPPPIEVAMDIGVYGKGRFIGDPTADAETECTFNGEFEIEEDEQWAFMKEEERLSVVVAAITKEAFVIPRGALIKTPNGLIIENKTFSGLNKLEATSLTSYFHLDRPENPWDKNITGRADYNLTLDFLHSISNEIPVGSWSVQLNKLETLSTVRSLYWPGSVGFCVLESPIYGWFYSGTGRKNWDVPFMVPPLPNPIVPFLTNGLGSEDAGEAGGDSSMINAKNNYKATGK